MRGYRGLTTSHLIAGAGPGMEGLEEINDGWDALQPTMEGASEPADAADGKPAGGKCTAA